MERPDDPVGSAPNHVIAALHALTDAAGRPILKEKERPRVLHAYGCPYVKDWSVRCTCPGGPEIMWPDFDELDPIRHYISPERFHARH